MRRLALVAATALVALAAGASTASATSECRGFDVCVPVAGPWVLAPAGTPVQFQLACPRRFVVGGLDAELSTPAVDLAFLGNLGSPISPGVTSSTAAVFLGRFLRLAGTASFRPHVGCIPASGGGGRVPTALVKVFPPSMPKVLRVVQLPVRAGTTRHVTGRCRRGQRLVAATHAIGFYRRRPPTGPLTSAVRVTQHTSGSGVRLTVRASRAVCAGRAIVQLDLLCAR